MNLSRGKLCSQQLMKATDTSWSQGSSVKGEEERFRSSIKRRDQGEFNVKVFSSSTRISCKLASKVSSPPPEFQTEFSMTRRFLPFQSFSRKITNYRSLSSNDVHSETIGWSIYISEIFHCSFPLCLAFGHLFNSFVIFPELYLSNLSNSYLVLSRDRIILNKK